MSCARIRFPIFSLAVVCVSTTVAGCSVDWDAYFAGPQQGAGGSGGSGTGGGIASNSSTSAGGAGGSNSSSGNGGSATSASGGSGGGSGALCDPKKPFGVPVIVQSLLTTGGEGSLRLSADELTGVFQQYSGSNTTLYVATRTTPTGDFATPTELANVNTAASQQDPTLSSDGLTMLFAQGPAIASDHVFVATRTSVAKGFTGVVELASVNSIASDVQPYLRPDGGALYLVSNRNAAPYAIYRSTGSVAKGFSAPVAVTELNTPSGEGTPTITPDDKVIYFSSARTGVGLNDVWRAERNDTSAAFSTPVNVIEVNTVSNDDPSWISADECRLYMSSDRNGSRHIYFAQRPL